MRLKTALPFLTVACFLTFFWIFAETEVFAPVIEYIHSDNITPLQGALCIGAAIICFYFVFRLLVFLGKSMLPKKNE